MKGGDDVGIIAAAQIAIAAITDPIQQDAAPASPSVGMLWLDTGVKPPLLKRWTGSQWETVNDTTEDFRQVEAQLTVMEDNIRTAVTDLSRLETSMLDKADMTQMKELLAGKADADLMLQLSTELKQTSQSITAIISQVAGLEGATAPAGARRGPYQPVFRHAARGGTNCNRNRDFDVRIDNEKLSFRENGQEIAYVSNSQLYITAAEVTQKLTIGNYSFTRLSDGSLALLL